MKFLKRSFLTITLISLALTSIATAQDKTDAARVLLVGTCKLDYGTESKDFDLQLFNLGDRNVLLCVPKGSRVSPFSRTAVMGTFVVANEKTMDAGILTAIRQLLKRKEEKAEHRFVKLQESTALVLVADTFWRNVDEKSRKDYPPDGKAQVVGKPLCAKRDLKLTQEPTLAIANGSLPVVLDGPLRQTKVEGMTRIRAVGTLRVDARLGALQLTAEEIEPPWARAILQGRYEGGATVQGTLTPHPKAPVQLVTDKKGLHWMTGFKLLVDKNIVSVGLDRNADPTDVDDKAFSAGLVKHGLIVEGKLAVWDNKDPDTIVEEKDGKFVTRTLKPGEKLTVAQNQFTASLYPDVGKLRVYDPKKDADLVREGGLTIRGKALPGKYDLGNGKQANLAIENGPYPIIIVGTVSEKVAKWNGMMVVRGSLHPKTALRELWIVPEKIELVGK